MTFDWTAIYAIWNIVVSAVAAAAWLLAWQTRRGAAAARLAERVVLLEQRVEDTPNAKAMHELSLSISAVGGELKATVARLEGLGEIVKRLDRITERQESYLLSKGRG